MNVFSFLSLYAVPGCILGLKGADAASASKFGDNYLCSFFDLALLASLEPVGAGLRLASSFFFSLVLPCFAVGFYVYPALVGSSMPRGPLRSILTVLRRF